jgi:hypothetical protein
MLNKSLLELLKEEDRLVYNAKFNKETYEMLKNEEKNERLASEYKDSMKKAEQDLLDCRKGIARYLKFLEALIED